MVILYPRVHWLQCGKLNPPPTCLLWECQRVRLAEEAEPCHTGAAGWLWWKGGSHIAGRLSWKEKCPWSLPGFWAVLLGTIAWDPRPSDFYYTSRAPRIFMELLPLTLPDALALQTPFLPPRGIGLLLPELICQGFCPLLWWRLCSDARLFGEACRLGTPNSFLFWSQGISILSSSEPLPQRGGDGCLAVRTQSPVRSSLAL